MTTTLSPTNALLDQIPALATQFDTRARETETLATLPADLAGEAKAAGLFRLAMPAALGGLEVDPAVLVEVIEELSRADASAGWCTAIANATAFFAWLDPVVAADLLAGRADLAVSGSLAPLGRLAPTRAGYRLTGRWPFVSGCRHADWFFQGGFVMAGEAPRMIPGRGPDWRLTALPASAIEIIDNWDVAGLRGTGSHDVAVAGVDVPEAYTIAPFFQPANHPGPIWRFPFFTLIGTLFAGVPLGIGRRALDEFTALAKTKTRAGATATLAAEDDIQLALVRAEGGLRAARSFVFDTLGTLWETACLGDVPDSSARARFLLANQQAMRAARDAVDTAFGLAGASAIYADHPLQRCFRDLHAAAQHVYFSPTSAKRYARNQFGVAQPEFMF